MTPKNIYLYEFFVFNQLEKQIFNNIIFVTTGYVVDSWLYLTRLFNHFVLQSILSLRIWTLKKRLTSNQNYKI